ncbi:hypothetical protein AB5I41_01355 [Sphingomonas sp. MMS24-JH45]
MAYSGTIRTQAHGQLIERILTDFPGAQTTGFKQAYRSLEEELDVWEPTDFIIDFLLPDAYRINRETQELEIFEGRGHLRVTSRKVETLGMIWFYWDAECSNVWLPVLFIVNRYGQTSRFDLRDAYYGEGPFAIAEHPGTLAAAVARDPEVTRLQEAQA